MKPSLSSFTQQAYVVLSRRDCPWVYTLVVGFTHIYYKMEGHNVILSENPKLLLIEFRQRRYINEDKL
jgi:hypothetical protein